MIPVKISFVEAFEFNFLVLKRGRTFPLLNSLPVNPFMSLYETSPLYIRNCETSYNWYSTFRIDCLQTQQAKAGINYSIYVRTYLLTYLLTYSMEQSPS